MFWKENGAIWKQERCEEGQRRIIQFFDTNGVQTVTDGSGFINYYYDSGQLMEKSSMQDGLRNGSTVKYLADGTKKYEGAFKNGVPNGEWQYWYETGAIWKKMGFVNGKINGSYMLYHPNGQISHQGQYLNGNRNGKWEAYFENGDKDWVGEYAQGKERETLNRKEIILLERKTGFGRIISSLEKNSDRVIM